MVAELVTDWPNSLRLGIASACGQDKFSDLKIRCGERVWSVHKVVVCSQSDYFDRALNRGFKEGQEGIIELQDDDPTFVDMMVNWFYHTDYIAPADSKPSFHASVFTLGDKYLLPGLSECAHMKFDACVYNGSLDEFAATATSLYEMDSDINAPLRQSLVSHVVEVWEKRYGVDDSGEGEEETEEDEAEAEGTSFREVLKQSPKDFAIELAMALGGRIMSEAHVRTNGW